MKLNFNFQRGGEGFKLKNLLWEGHGYFMEWQSQICRLLVDSSVSY